MFMILCLKGDIVTRQVQLPTNTASLRHLPLRSREKWMEKMNALAVTWSADFYAFRYRGQWHLCGAHQHHNVIRSIDGDARSAAEMWVTHRQDALDG